MSLTYIEPDVSRILKDLCFRDTKRGDNVMADSLIVAIPTHDLRAVIPSLLELGLVSEQLNRPLHFAVGEASNIPRSRNVVLQQLRDAYPQTPNPWVLWLDSDIVLFPGYTDVIVAGIQWAEAHECGIVANYRMANGESVLIANKEGPPYHHYTADELDTFPNYYTTTQVRDHLDQF